MTCEGVETVERAIIIIYEYLLNKYDKCLSMSRLSQKLRSDDTYSRIGVGGHWRNIRKIPSQILRIFWIFRLQQSIKKLIYVKIFVGIFSFSAAFVHFETICFHPLSL